MTQALYAHMNNKTIKKVNLNENIKLTTFCDLNNTYFFIISNYK
jgi:hypothetical protein